MYKYLVLVLGSYPFFNYFETDTNFEQMVYYTCILILYFEK